MSRGDPVERGGLASTPTGPVHDLAPGRAADLGPGTTVRRLLPTLGRRMVGAWCFLDHYGPDALGTMDVWPHPHIGLQTVSWLFEGSVHHEDSLDNDDLLVPGVLGLMTAGHGIAHAETSPSPDVLHGAQLWVALPDDARDQAPAWDFHAELPAATLPGATVRVIVGAYEGATSPGRTYTPIVGLDVTVAGQGELVLEADFEHAASVIAGHVWVDGVDVPAGSLLYLGTGRRRLPLRGEGRLLLLGGEPFSEPIVMWWNLVGRSHDEIDEARRQWADGERFGAVPGWSRRTDAPPLALALKPRGRT
ncbi:MAG TPA: pirin family protein [Mycobacteriales bacterium]